MNCLKIRQNSSASGWKTFAMRPMKVVSLSMPQAWNADRGLEDIAAGRVKSLEDYERERGL